MPLRHPFRTGFPCPNCGKQRTSASASCLACRYPRHDRKHTASPNTEFARRPFQFQLWWLVAGTTVATIFLGSIPRKKTADSYAALQVRAQSLGFSIR